MVNVHVISAHSIVCFRELTVLVMRTVPYLLSRRHAFCFESVFPAGPGVPQLAYVMSTAFRFLRSFNLGKREAVIYEN